MNKQDLRPVLTSHPAAVDGVVLAAARTGNWTITYRTHFGELRTLRNIPARQVEERCTALEQRGYTVEIAPQSFI